MNYDNQFKINKILNDEIERKKLIKKNIELKKIWE